MAQQTKKANKCYFDDLGNEVVLTSEIARGGEGVIYNIKNKSDVVAKIYFVSKNRRKSFAISDKNINFTRILKINCR